MNYLTFPTNTRQDNIAEPELLGSRKNFVKVYSTPFMSLPGLLDKFAQPPEYSGWSHAWSCQSNSAQAHIPAYGDHCRYIFLLSNN